MKPYIYDMLWLRQDTIQENTGGKNLLQEIRCTLTTICSLLKLFGPDESNLYVHNAQSVDSLEEHQFFSLS